MGNIINLQKLTGAVLLAAGVLTGLNTASAQQPEQEPLAALRWTWMATTKRKQWSCMAAS